MDRWLTVTEDVKSVVRQTATHRLAHTSGVTAVEFLARSARCPAVLQSTSPTICYNADQRPAKPLSLPAKPASQPE